MSGSSCLWCSPSSEVVRNNICWYLPEVATHLKGLSLHLSLLKWAKIKNEIIEVDTRCRGEDERFLCNVLKIILSKTSPSTFNPHATSSLPSKPCRNLNNYQCVSCSSTFASRLPYTTFLKNLIKSFSFILLLFIVNSSSMIQIVDFKNRVVNLLWWI